MAGIAKTLDPQQNLATKLCRILGQATYVQKKGRNTAQGYNYAMEADFLELIKPLLTEEKIIVLPRFQFIESHDGQTKNGSPVCRVTLALELTFLDAESGTSFVVSTIGQGVDSQDKAPYKAMTGALKYALSKTFLIPTGDDPENDSPEEKEEKKAAATPKTDVKQKEEPAVNVERWLAAISAERTRIGKNHFLFILEKNFGIPDKPEPELSATLLALSDSQKRALYAALVARKAVQPETE